MAEAGVVLHQGAIGDFVLSMSIVQAMRAARPVDRVVAIASAPSARLAAGRSVVDECIAPDSIGVHTLYSLAGELDDRLRSFIGRAAWVLSFLGDERSQPGIAIQSVRKPGSLCIDSRPRPETLGQRRHISEQWADDVRSQGVSLGAITPPQISMALDFASSDRVMIHPGSGGREKCWPFERFLSLADAMKSRAIEWLLGPAELERQPDWFPRLKSRQTAGDGQILIENDIVAIAEQIAASTLYIGNDAGMTHVAAALGIRTIAIFGPTDPRVWRPLNANATVVAPPEPAPITAVEVQDVLRRM